MKALWSLCVTLLVPSLFPAAEPVDYSRQIKPLLAQRCVSCHGPEKQKSSLRLDSAASILKGGNSGPAVVPGKSSVSLLIQAVCGADGVSAMPPKGERLSTGQVALLRTWIDDGAKAPNGETVQQPRSSKHWAFQPIVRPAEQIVQNTSWVRNPIDRFILARLEKAGIKPSPEADRVTLIRRLSLDLLGLPPTPAEVDAFVADKRPDAYEHLVERLLASPHYGERWGRHWLDQARYADSNGYSIDAPRSIWKYRDWVIDALNRDLPFDQFTIEQLAGDLLPNATLEQRVATGFHRNTQINQEGGIDLEQFRIESIVDRVNTTGTVFLGLTVGCCQCHDHKFDPIKQREYYQLFAFFNSVDEPTLELASAEQVKKRNDLQGRIRELSTRLKPLDTATPERFAMWEGSLSAEERAKLPARIQTILAIAVNGRNAMQDLELLTFFRNLDQVRHVVGGLGARLPIGAAVHVQGLTIRRALDQQIAELKTQLPVIPTTLVVQECKTPRTTYIHLGGDFLRKGAVVSPAVPAVLPALPTKEKPNRLDLAHWIVDPRNPLTARVAMNRFWHVYFGAGLVETDNDFGTQGTLPSHPELLDYLATEFVARKWSMKAMHRQIVTSATYRQASKARPDLATLDPRNRLLARQSRLRLEAEVVRDVALSASGLLNPTIGGPSVFPPQPKGVYNFTQVPRDWKPSVGPERFRRGLYTYFWRSAPHPGLIVFDAPDATGTCTRRNRSNTPLQALTLLNDQAYFEFAQSLAGRILNDAQASDEARLAHGFRLCLGRAPAEREQQLLTRLLARQREVFARDPKEAKPLAPASLTNESAVVQHAAWTMVARVLLNLDEFITRE
jgi:mono/diheme cytochrome c family protein